MAQTKRKQADAAASDKSPEDQAADLKSKLFKSFLPIILIIILKKLPLSEDQLFLYGRMLFGFRIILTLVIASLIFLRIRNATDKDEVVKAHEVTSSSTGVSELVPEMSVEAYDTGKLLTFLKGQGIQVVIILVLHLKWHFTQPFFISTFMALQGIYDNELFKIHILKLSTKDRKDLMRPFPEAASGSVAGFFQQPSTTSTTEKKED